jgi:hypothetical protein
MTIWAKNIPDRGNSKCKSPEVGLKLHCLKHRMETSVEEQSEVGAGQNIMNKMRSVEAQS